MSGKDQSILGIDEMIRLIDHFSKNGLGELEVEDMYGVKFCLRAKQTPAPASATANETYIPSYDAVALAQTAQQKREADTGLTDGNVMKAPIVGTFYTASAPDQAPFVEVGQTVKKGDVLFIIESMKLMNEVQSEFDGEVVQILCENAAAVEYGQPVMVIR